jgi:hypothetical protein
VISARLIRWLLFFFISEGAMMVSPAFPEGTSGIPAQGSPEDQETSAEVGTREIPGAQGAEDKIYFSVSTPEEEKKAGQEEKEKLEKSWDVLKNIVIDRRKQR